MNLFATIGVILQITGACLVVSLIAHLFGAPDWLIVVSTASTAVFMTLAPRRL